VHVANLFDFLSSFPEKKNYGNEGLAPERQFVQQIFLGTELKFLSRITKDNINEFFFSIPITTCSCKSVNHIFTILRTCTHKHSA
jgi:hypothetical protein